jgi:tetratricopeptide (TPR) repeat protein
MKRQHRLLPVAAFLIAAALPAAAWGPRTQLAIVTTAIHVLSRDANIPLLRLEKEVRGGAMLAMEKLNELYPELPEEPIRAIEGEMLLLKAVRGDKIDPYLAWRLGALAKLAAVSTAPMREESATWRNLYYTDVDRHIGEVPLEKTAWRTIDPNAWFPDLMLAAQNQSAEILREYKNGNGFEGVARAGLKRDATRSLQAVLNVWHTILAVDSIPANVSIRQRQRYVLSALDFYIQRNDAAEIEKMADRLEKIIPPDNDMKVKIGDLYFKAGMHEKAVTLYHEVMRSDPSRRDVVEKIAAWYVDRGETALAQDRLEAALDNFNNALEADPLHSGAERKRLQTAALMEERKERLAMDRAAIEEAEKFRELAEIEAEKERYAEATALLRQSARSFQQVSDEFPPEMQLRIRGLQNIRFRMNELKQEIMANARAYSGKGKSTDIDEMIRKRTRHLEENALQKMLAEDYRDMLDQMENDLRPALEIR